MAGTGSGPRRSFGTFSQTLSGGSGNRPSRRLRPMGRRSRRRFTSSRASGCVNREPELRPKTVASYRWQLTHHLLPYFGALVDRLDRAEYRRCLQGNEAPGWPTRSEPDQQNARDAGAHPRGRRRLRAGRRAQSRQGVATPGERNPSPSGRPRSGAASGLARCGWALVSPDSGNARRRRPTKRRGLRARVARRQPRERDDQRQDLEDGRGRAACRHAPSAPRGARHAQGAKAASDAN